MPETREIDTQPRYIRRGDVITQAGQSYVATDAPVAKQRYAYVNVEYTDENEVKQLKLPLNQNVTVSREFPTREESAARTRLDAINWANDALKRAQNRLTEAKNKLVEALQMRDVSWHGRYWANYAEAQLELGLWEYVHTVAEKREVDLNDALLLVRDEITKRLLDLGHFLPRSTDMLNNYCDGLEAEVRLRFIRDIEWRT